MQEAAKRAKQLLSCREVIQHLDESSEERRERRFVTWHRVLQAVQTFVMKEAEYLQKSVAKSKSQTVASREKNLKMVRSVYFVLDIAWFCAYALLPGRGRF